MFKFMKPFLFQLITPLNYLRIKLKYKWIYDYLVPAILTLIVFTVLFIVPHKVNLLGDHGLIHIVTDLVKILVGFYIASLAAVATFPREEMDKPLDGNSATLNVIRGGQEKKIELSRRRFLCYMFGYLALMGLIVYFCGALASLMSDNIHYLIAVNTLRIARWLFLACYIFLVSNLFVTTLLGLHFMTDRIHR